MTDTGRTGAEALADLLAPRDHRPPDRPGTAVERLVRAAAVAVLAVEVAADAAFVWHRCRSGVRSWWQGVEHREAVRAHERELEFLAGRLHRAR